MVTILGINKSFISVRWKLVSTYLLLILLTLLLINSFINTSLKSNNIQEKKISLLTQGSIISNRVSPNFYAIEKEHTKIYVEKVVKNMSLEINSRIMVVDKDHKVLIDSYDTYEDDIIDYVNEIEDSLNGKSTVNQYNLANIGKVLYVAVPIIDKGRIVGSIFISSSLEDVLSNVEKRMNLFILLSLGAIVISGVVSFFFADVISTPIENLTDIVRGVTQGKTDIKAPVKGHDELANLSNSFNHMITKISEIDNQRKKFVSNVSHELRTPLSSIKILSESLLHSPEVEKEVYLDFLSDINSEVDRLNNIINSLLYLVELEKDQMELEFKLSYVNYLIRTVINTLKPLAQQKQIKLEFVEADEVQIYLDKEKIQQCLINVIANSIKYTPNGGEIFLRILSTKDEVVIEVEDNGMGIPEEKLFNIFDRFYRVDDARARETGGTGLGLSISQQIINLHGGRIEVKSKMNVGTSFFLILPKRTEFNWREVK